MECVPFLDHASGAPLHPAACAVLMAAAEATWADPQRLYGAARRVRLLLDGAREEIAAAVGARPEEVSFTASGTQAAHLAVLGGLAARSRVGRHLVTSAVEHSCVLAAADLHRDAGGEATIVGVDTFGRVDPATMATALRPDTVLASLQHANHEVGTLQPVAAVAASCAAVDVPLHVDAAQTVGRLPVDMATLGASLLTASAHKWGGPAGVGVLVVRAGTRWRSPLPADDREGGRVPGFPNVAGAVAAAAALTARLAEMTAEEALLRPLVDRLRAEVPRRVPDVAVVGDPVHRLPGLVTFSCLYVDGEALLGELDRLGIAVSSGSSCTAATRTPSHVLAAMGVLTSGNVRVSLGRASTAADVHALLDVLPSVVSRLRALAGADRL